MNSPMTLADGLARARFLMQVRDRMSAEIAGWQNGSLVVLNGGPCTAARVAGLLGVSEQSANNYLRKLWRAGLVDRDRMPVDGGGLAYTYKLREDDDDA